MSAHLKSFKQEWQAKSEECYHHASHQAGATTFCYNEHAQPLPALQGLQQVNIQDYTSKRWDKVGKVMGHCRSWQYQILFPSGCILWRNQHYLCPAIIAAQDLTLAAVSYLLLATRRLHKDEVTDERDEAQE